MSRLFVSALPLINVNDAGGATEHVLEVFTRFSGRRNVDRVSRGCRSTLVSIHA
jgi:hypothetical protein